MESVAGLDWATWETAAKNLEALAYRETANSVAPACVTTCMGRGVIGTCKNSANFDCLCDSVAYQTSVLVRVVVSRRVGVVSDDADTRITDLTPDMLEPPLHAG